MVVLLAAARVAVLVGVILLVILEDQVAAAGDPGLHVSEDGLLEHAAGHRSWAQMRHTCIARAPYSFGGGLAGVGMDLGSGGRRTGRRSCGHRPWSFEDPQRSLRIGTLPREGFEDLFEDPRSSLKTLEDPVKTGCHSSRRRYY